MFGFSLILALAGCSEPAPTKVAPQTTTTTTTPSYSTPTTTEDTHGLEVFIVGWPDTPEVGDDLIFEATVSSDLPNAPIDVRWWSDWDGDLHSETLSGTGAFTMTTDSLSLGDHDLFVEVTQMGVTQRRQISLGVCQWPEMETFDTASSLEGWTLFGNAQWDPGQWLEITTLAEHANGAVYFVERRVSPGDVSIEFSVATGGGINTGADGFAVNVISALDEAELSDIVNMAGTGGCLGYATDGLCGGVPITAFHIEFDTWFNADIQDPAHGNNHTAIALNGDPVPIMDAEIASLEDLVWRDVKVDIEASEVTTTIDGVVVMQGSIDGWTFDGGYIGVSGSTGGATNYHRFDNLKLSDTCVVPERESATPPYATDG